MLTHCDIWIAAIAAVPLTITALTALIIALRAHAVVKTIVNGKVNGNVDSKPSAG